MLKMKDYEKIRRAVLSDNISQREVARIYGHGRDTIRKALANPNPTGYQRRVEADSPVLDPVKALIDSWLKDEEDRKVKRKQRSNAKVIWKRLKDEHGFTGSIYPIRRYLRKRKHLSLKNTFFPLKFSPGEEAQIDWGQADVRLCNDTIVTVHLFCMRLSYSRASYVRAYLSEKLECFMDGHVQAFNFFGGSAHCNTYDNLKTAITFTGRKNKRRLNERFIHLRSHYLFESRFCNVESGNEKGRVENLVKLVQRDFLAGVPAFNDLEDLNKHLEKCCIADLDRKAPQSSQTRKELFEEEKGELVALRHGDFEACILHSTFASKLSLVQVDNNFYSIPVRQAFQPITAKAFADRIEIICNGKTIAVHKRSWDKNAYIFDYMHYIPLLEIKPGGLNSGHPFKGNPWGAEFERFHKELIFRYQDDGSKQFVDILLLFTKYPEPQVKSAVKKCMQRRAFSFDAVLGILEYEPPIQSETVSIIDLPELHTETTGIVSAKVFDNVFLEEADDDTQCSIG